MERILFSRKQVLITIFIGVFALIIRLLFILYYSNSSLAGGDAAAFWSYAEGIVNGQGFRSIVEPWLADRPPLYSYFLSGIFLLGGKDPFIVFMVQAGLGALTASVFYIFASNVIDTFGSLVAGLFFAIFPHFLLFTKQILTEAIYIPLWVFLLASFLFLKVKKDTKLIIGAGIFLGLLALVRREAIFSAGIMAIMLIGIGYSNDWKKVFQILLVLFMTASLVTLPWLIRNYYVLGRPVLSSSGGVNFMVGNNPLGNGAYSPPPQEWAIQFQGLSELARNQKAWDLSLQWIQERPADFLNLLPKKLMILWGPAHNIFLDCADIFLIICCLPGLFRVTQHNDGWKAIGIVSLLPILTTTLIGLVFVGAWRYRLIVYPGLFLLAGYGAMQMQSWCIDIMHQNQQHQNNAGTS